MGLITRDEHGNVSYLVRVDQNNKIDLPPEGVHTLCVAPSKNDYTVDFGKTASIKIDDVANGNSSEVEKEVDCLRFAEGISRVSLYGICFPVVLKKIIFPSTLYSISINPKRDSTHKNSAIEELDFSKVTSTAPFRYGSIRSLNHLENLDLTHIDCDSFEAGCITSLPRLRTLSLPRINKKSAVAVQIASGAFEYIGSTLSYTNLFLSGKVTLSDAWIKNSRIDNLILGGSSIRFSGWFSSIPSPVSGVGEMSNIHIKKIWITAEVLFKFLAGDPQLFFNEGFFNKNKSSSVFEDLYIVGTDSDEFKKITDKSWLLVLGSPDTVMNMRGISWFECFRSRLRLDFLFNYRFILTKKSKWVDILRKQSLKDEELTIPDSTIYSPPDFPWE